MPRRSIFRDGLFHADPHPGNIVVVDGDRVGLLDFGKVGRIDTDTQDGIDDLVAAALSEDLDGVMDGLLRLCDPPATLDRAALRKHLRACVEEMMRAPDRVYGKLRFDLHLNRLRRVDLDLVGDLDQREVEVAPEHMSRTVQVRRTVRLPMHMELLWSV